MYPRVTIDLRKFRRNIEIVKEKLDQKGIEIFAVSKVFSGNPMIAKEFEWAGIKSIGESRMENPKKIQGLDMQKVLLRLPMQSEIQDLIEYADISLNSEISTLELISEAALRRGFVHEVILMVDFGDLREGFFKREALYAAVERCQTLDGVKVIGVGTNLTCFGAVIPTIDHMNQLVEIKQEIKRRFDLDVKYISGGNSSSYYLLDDENFPPEINNLRIGEIFVCGNETAYSSQVPGTYDDVFKLEAEIIELKDKPSLPIGEPGVDAFGRKPVYEDQGEMVRAICAVGRQDVGIDGLKLVDEGIEILGSSSDHMILNLTHASKIYKVGDTIQFKLKYGGILNVMTSEYINKVYINSADDSDEVHLR